MSEKFYCKKCGGAIRSKHATCFKCSDIVQKSIEKYKAAKPDDYVVCPLCGLYGADLTHHAWHCHGMRKNEYVKETGLDCIKCERLRQRFVGKNNPGYKHGGKLSPFSKKSGRSKEQIKASMKKANEKAARNSIRTIGYWMNKGCDEDEAKEMVSWYQARNLDWFIHYYGEDDGRKRYNRKRERWMKTMAKKSPKEMADINRRKCSKGSAISKLEQEFAKNLEGRGLIVETQFPIHTKRKVHVYDIRVGNLLIEINGDLWHMNPEIYKPTDKNRVTGMIAEEKWIKDDKKKSDAAKRGFRVVTIWESDLKRDYNKYIDMCVNFVKEDEYGVAKAS